MSYVANFNVPGYLPDNPPELFDTIQEAWSYLLEEARYCVEDIGIDLELYRDNLSAYNLLLEHVDRNSTGSYIVGELYPLCYFVDVATD